MTPHPSPPACPAAPPRLRAELPPDLARDPSAQWARSLLDLAEPYAAPPGRRERVWRALQVGRRTPIRRLRLGLAVMVLVAGGLCASAALAGWPPWLARTLGTAGPPAAPAAPPSRATQPTLAPAPPAAVEPPAPAETPPSAEATLAVPGETPRGAPARRAARPPAPENTTALLEAMRALRVERDPGRARGLLTAYLERHPRGALAEEALVMLVEAAFARHDGDAAALAARYFKLYPKGPFRGQVERTVAAYAKP
jgi:hypothetical protein